MVESITKKHPQDRSGIGCAVAFLGLFAAIGLAVGVPLFLASFRTPDSGQVVFGVNWNSDRTAAVAVIFFFTVLPLLMLVAVTSASRKSRQNQVASATSQPSSAESGPVVLRAQSSPIGRLVGMTVLCLIWNALVGGFTYVAWSESTAGGVGCAALFLVPFQLVGLALIAAVPYQVLALANPRPTLTVSRRVVPLGGSFTVDWQLSGAAHRIGSLRLTLDGHEEAQFRRGTHTSTHKNVFHHDVVKEVTDAASIQRGTATVRIPAGTMHTFTADHNKIFWTLNVHGDIRRWPDMDETFAITVTSR